jgi:hypothetical protein
MSDDAYAMTHNRSDGWERDVHEVDADNEDVMQFHTNAGKDVEVVVAEASEGGSAEKLNRAKRLKRLCLLNFNL